MDIETLITQVATRQLPRQVPAYIEEKLGKMLPTSVLYGTQILFFNPMIYWWLSTFISKTIYKEINVL